MSQAKKNWILFVIDNRLSSNFDVVKRFAWDDMSDDDKTVVCLKYSSEGQLIKWRKLNINIWLYGNVEYVGLLLFKDLVLIKYWILSNVFMKSGTPIYWSWCRTFIRILGMLIRNEQRVPGILDPVRGRVPIIPHTRKSICLYAINVWFIHISKSFWKFNMLKKERWHAINKKKSDFCFKSVLGSHFDKVSVSKFEFICFNSFRRYANLKRSLLFFINLFRCISCLLTTPARKLFEM